MAKIDSTYNVTGGVLLLRSKDSTAALSGVQSAATLDSGLTRASAAAGLAADLSDGVPVAHLCGVCCVGGVKCRGW